MGVRDKMKQAHSQAQTKYTPPVKTRVHKEEPAESAIEVAAVEEKEQPRVEAVKPAAKPIVSSTQTNKGISTKLKQIARDDVPFEHYGLKPVKSNFDCYNKEIFKWLQSFSSENQFNGGVAIHKSQITEMALEVLFYELGINPIGYESQQALREDIQMKLKGN
ncbi:hypothetical protein KC480_05965 [Bacillus velezensis]|uniref:hypothetical protein n=1 Tax=Bacillus velezensis TaxID=492670 RepID=UPI001E5B3E6C|nr:hypothetical protein [Bacillus velezensis]MCD7911071.1 hypothetical protein [Bacillus velezensis]